MIKSFFRSLLPQITPSHIAFQGEATIIREQIVQAIFLVASIVSLVAIIPFSLLSVINFYAGLSISIAILLLMVFRSLPLLIRSGFVILSFYIGGLIMVNSTGNVSDLIGFFLAATVLGTVLLGSTNAGIFLLAVTLITYFFFIFDSSSGWIINIILFSSVNIIITATLIAVLNYLSNSLFRQRAFAKELEQRRIGLEIQVSRATSDLERRLLQVRTASEISRSISSTLNAQELLQQVVDLIKDRFNLYYAGAFVVEETGKYAVLRAGTGEPGRRMVEEGHRLPLTPTSMIGSAVISQIPRIAQEVEAEMIRFRNPMLPDTQSELALPIQSRSQILGALTVQSDRRNAFKEDDIVILQGIADSLGVALENAELFERSQQDLEEIRLLNRQFISQSWNEVLETYGEVKYSYENKNAPGRVKKTIDVPLQLRDETIGKISLETAVEDYDPADLDLIEAIATQTALALENARLLEETQRRAIQEQTVNQLTAQFSRSLSIEEILRTAIQELGHLPGVNEVAVHLISDQPQPTTTGGNGHDVGQLHKEENG